MPSSLGDFKASIGGFTKKLDGRLDELVRNVAFAFAAEVIVGGDFSPGTPVDTGFARESWYVVLGEAASGPVPGELRGGQLALDQATVTLLGVQAGQIVFILNNAAYILALEYGHSRQAPTGMVRIAAANAQQLVSRVARQMVA